MKKSSSAAPPKITFTYIYDDDGYSIVELYRFVLEEARRLGIGVSPVTTESSEKQHPEKAATLPTGT